MPTNARRWRLALSVETVLLAASLFWALACNRPFLRAALGDAADPSGWGLAIALVLALTALHFLLLAPLATRRSLKPLLAAMLLLTALATHYMQRLGVYLDPSMLRNTLHSHFAEARELVGVPLLGSLLLYAGLPLVLLARVELIDRPWRRAFARRALALALAAAALVGTLLLVFQPLASVVREQREVRYLVTPANLLWSAGVVLAADARGTTQPRRAIGLDAQPGPAWAKRQRPLLLVLVVGETVRSANWGLSGYARQTTPQLAALPVVNFERVHACGTNTEVSLPCMFAPVGRRDYDETRIRSSESLLHVLARAGVAVEWRDNQSGCKGVCDGLPSNRARPQPALCDGSRCLDEVLLDGIDAELGALQGTRLLVLHMLGNHGPSYFRRYPREFARFQPACENDDLRRCSDEQIVNAYDNALLYTDALLARLIGKLQAHAGRVDSAMVFLSDHGESLGEAGLVLHGLPYAIAPAVQTEVPMTLWWSAGFARATTLDGDCLRQRATQPAQHDHLFHTVLGLLDVRTALYAPAWDLSRACSGK